MKNKIRFVAMLMVVVMMVMALPTHVFAMDRYLSIDSEIIV